MPARRDSGFQDMSTARVRGPNDLEMKFDVMAHTRGVAPCGQPPSGATAVFRAMRRTVRAKLAPLPAVMAELAAVR